MISNLEASGSLPPLGAALVSPRVQRDSRLQAVFHHSPCMRWGERGPAVAKVQQALVHTGIPLPLSTRNCNRRGWTCDSEAIAGIFDDSLPGDRTLPFAQRLRMALRAEHLNVSPRSLINEVASAALWLSPPLGARVAPYNQNAGVDPGWHPRISWDRIVDPCLPTPGHPC